MSLDDHSARGSAAGFTFQFERAFHWLCQSPAGAVIGIETGDDVSITSVDGALILEQDKHSVREEAKPFGDRSKDLWNTILIWLQALDSREVPIGTRFLMVTNKDIGDGLARQIGAAKEETEVMACIAGLETASLTPPESIASLVGPVLSTESRENLKLLIRQCELADAGSSTAGRALRELSVSQLQLPAWCADATDSIADELLGWLHRTILSLWQANKPGWVERDHFINQLHAVLDRRKRRETRERAEHLIPLNEDRVGKEKGRPFVKQLHLVTEDESTVDTAVREYLRCSMEKFRLSEEGNVTDEDWIAFEVTLKARWQKIRGRILRMRQDSTEIDQGFEIFYEVTENHREKLAGNDTEQVYLTSGTYHRLADVLDVGWHPRFVELMQETEVAQ